MKPWPCQRCTHLLPPDTTGTHICGKPWPVLSRAQHYLAGTGYHRNWPLYIGTPKQIRGETENEPIECATFEDAT